MSLRSGRVIRAVAHRGARAEPGGRREIDQLLAKTGTMPRILCWKCRKLTPFELDHCQYCGSAFAGSTGGAYGSGRVATSRTLQVPKADPEPPRRTLAQIFEDLQRVHDVSGNTRKGRPRGKQVSLNLYQCPACGRFVSEQARDCVCGVRFAADGPSTRTCPECGSHVPSDTDACPVCSVRFDPGLDSGTIVYVCPRCGSHVTSDAVRCSCGVWFED